MAPPNLGAKKWKSSIFSGMVFPFFQLGSQPHNQRSGIPIVLKKKNFRTQTPKEIQDGLRELAERYPKRAGHLIFQSPGENSGHNVFTEKQLRKQRENVKRLNPNAVVTGQPMLKEEQEAAWRMQSVQHPYRSFVLEHNEHQRIVDKRGVREGFG